MTAEPVQLMSTWIDLLALQSIYATVVFAAVWTVARLLRRRGPAVLYVLWALVFIRLVLPPGLSHPWSAGALVDRLAGQPLVSIGLDSAHGDADAIGRSATSSIASIEGTDGGGLSWKAILAVVWLVGVLATLATHRRRMVTCRRVVADARPVTSPTQVFLIEGWRIAATVCRELAA